jgi:hypothetical protein
LQSKLYGLFAIQVIYGLGGGVAKRKKERKTKFEYEKSFLARSHTKHHWG